MISEKTQTLDTMSQHGMVNMAARQAPLRELYAKDPAKAWIIDSAKTSSKEVTADNALYGHVVFECGLPVEMPVGVHTAVGGECDYPSPGEIFAAAIASCLDSTMRIIANMYGIGLDSLEVTAKLGVDVRGTLRVNESVPTAFQSVEVKIRVTGAKGVTDTQLDMLIQGAERSCILLQTLKNPPENIRVSREPAAG